MAQLEVGPVQFICRAAPAAVSFATPVAGSSSLRVKRSAVARPRESIMRQTRLLPGIAVLPGSSEILIVRLPALIRFQTDQLVDTTQGTVSRRSDQARSYAVNKAANNAVRVQSSLRAAS